ncbi:hypothetical protein ABMA28_007193 [Loxostege sticticalis]|uniref:Lipase domain-containing protein n=1 Tax=Loxostege sticticalis TaxID=481309 RepID=A0ABD0TQ48_LOXSC
MYTAVKCALLLSVAVAASGHSLGFQDVVFHLFTRNNRANSIPVLPTFESLVGGQAAQYFVPSRRTIIAIPTQNSDDETVPQFGAHVVSAHLDAEDVNVFLIDWSAGSSMYSEGLAQAPQCGQIIANFVNIMIRELSMSASLFRLVGHGLGGHIAGIAARQINGNVPHIISLDPSLHGWTHHPARLNRNDATVVEVLSTSAGILGYDQPLGDLNFFANGGTNQPGCGIVATCSRNYAFIYYGESVRSDVINGPKFVGTRCDNYQQALSNQCSGERDATFGGVSTKTSGAGIYTFPTNASPPFARD